MWKRPFWIKRLESALAAKSVVWLSGVRRVGKTTLTRSLTDIEYFDCELPRTRQLMDDPEQFLSGMRGRRVVLDEIHRLADPAQLLKIAADHFPDVSIVATGSSTLGASRKFRDTLAGRKGELWLTPMTLEDARAFDQPSVEHRMVHGGLPPFFLARVLPERDFQEWFDAYWAKDILELFRLERRHSFARFAELLFAASGGIFEATKYARPCEVSRQSISNYLAILESTFVAHVVRPYSTRKATEIVAAPKVYAFDTGFVCYYKGWHELRGADLGPLWEHIVLNELHAHLQHRNIFYWRDKRGHELDFVLSRRGGAPIVIECKWKSADFDAKALRIFRDSYPGGTNYVVSHDVDRAHMRRHGELEVHVVGVDSLLRSLCDAS